MPSRRLLSVFSSSGMLWRTHRCCTASAIENLRRTDQGMTAQGTNPGAVTVSAEHYQPHMAFNLAGDMRGVMHQRRGVRGACVMACW